MAGSEAVIRPARLRVGMSRLNPFGSMKVVLAVGNLRASGARLWVSLFNALSTRLACRLGLRVSVIFLE